MFFLLSPNEQRGGGGGALPGGRYQTSSFLFSFPCSADHERDWPPCKVVFFGLATNTLYSNTLNVRNNKQQYSAESVDHMCVCFLPIHSGHQVRWTYQPGSHRRKVTRDFSSTFFLRCVPYFFSREGFSDSFPSSVDHIVERNMLPVSHIHYFTVQQTTSGFGHRVKFFRVGNQYAECDK